MPKKTQPRTPKKAEDADIFYAAIIHYFKDPDYSSGTELGELEERGTFDILIISRNKDKAIETLINASSHPNWIPGARWGLVVETMCESLLEDGIMNEKEVYAVSFDNDGNATKFIPRG